jgi:hypothetical protein
MVVGRTSPRGGSVTILAPKARAAAATLPVTIAVEQRATASVEIKVIRSERRVELDATALGWFLFAVGLWDTYDHLAPVVGPFEAMILALTIAAAIARVLAD